MAKDTSIEWCDATMNPWIGCTKVSPGCDHCYAEQQNKFRGWTPQGWGAGMPRRRTSEQLWKGATKWNSLAFFECADCGFRGTATDMGREPKGPCQHLNAKPARMRVFCASLADVFDNEVDPQWRSDLLDLIARTPNLDWLLLTKRIGNVRPMVDAWVEQPDDETQARCWPMPNVWLGATIVNQEEAERDIPKLLAAPARVRFLSMEPLLGPVNVQPYFWSGDESGPLPGVDWVIAGGESGPKARPMHPDWARSLRDQCASAGVPFLFKQWGEWIGAGQPYPGRDSGEHALIREFGYDEANRHRLHRIGKKAAGRLLDGVTHDGFPEVAP